VPPWQPGRTDVREVLATSNDLTVAQVAHLFLTDQVARWERGERVPVEAYLHLHPALGATSPDAFDLVFNEFVLREKHGEVPAPSEYFWRFPQFAERIRRQVQFHQELCASDMSAAPTAGEESSWRGPDTGQEAAPKTGSDLPEVAGYEVLARLGKGGMGVVYQARQKSLKRLVALKLLSATGQTDEQAMNRLRREAEVVARLQHPNIVHIYEVGEQDGRPYLALELVEGNSLAAELAGAPLPPRQAAELAKVLAQAIHYAHSKGIVHRDLKPANILLQRIDPQMTQITQMKKEEETRNGEALGKASDGPAGLVSSSVLSVSSVDRFFPKITDFGLAKCLDQDGNQTQTGTLVGTPSYMAPEQADAKGHQVGAAADVYALGVILYEMLTGRPPFKADTPLNTVVQVLHQDPAPPTRLQPTVPRDLETICLKCLQKLPRQRYASAGDLAADLDRYLNGQPIKARRTPLWERAWKWACRHPTGAALLATLVGVLLAAGLGAWIYTTDLQSAVRQKDAEQARAQKNLQAAHEAIDQAVKRINKPGEVEVPEMREAREALLGDIQELCLRLEADKENQAPETRYYRAKALLILAELQQSQRRFVEAEKNYLEGLGQLEQLASDHPGLAEHGHDLARSRRHFAVLHYTQGRRDEAKRGLEEAVRYWGPLAGSSPVAQQELLLAHLDLGQEGLERREEHLSKALELGEQLLQQRPTDKEVKVLIAKAFHNRGLYRLSHSEKKAALADLLQAKDLLEELPRDRAGYREYMGYLAEVYKALGSCHGKMPEEEDFDKKAIAVAEELDRQFPDTFAIQDHLATSRYMLVACWARIAADKLKEGKEGEALMAKVVDLYERQSRDLSQGPYPWARWAMALDLLALVQSHTRSAKDAEAMQRKALAVAEQAVQHFPDDTKCIISLAASCCNLARICLQQRHFAEAVEACRRAIPNLEQAHQIDRANVEVKTALVNVLGNQAIGLAGVNRVDDAIKALDRAVQVDEARRVELWKHRILLLGGSELHVRATSEATSLAKVPQLTVAEQDQLYQTVVFCVGDEGMAGTTGAKDSGQDVPQLYEAAALALLTRLRSEGYFQGLLHRKQLEEGPALAPLRARPAFKQWLAETNDRK
jgi:serine/threonine protein kinase